MGFIITTVNDGICFECNESYINENINNEAEVYLKMMEFKEKALFVCGLYNWKILTDIHYHNNDTLNSRMSHNHVACGEK